MRPWPSGRARLVAQIGRWIDAHGTTACGRRLQAAEPLYAQCARQLWDCWEYHWRQAAEVAGAPADGFAVAARLEKCLGFQGGGRLGGNPLEDVVLATAVLHQHPVALQRFAERFRSRAIGLAVKANSRVREDAEDWWCQLLVHLMGVGQRPGKLRKYGGRCGLWNWLARVVRNFSVDWGHDPPGHSDEIEQIPASRHNPAEDRECQELLGGAVRRAIGQLDPEQRALLYLLFAEQLPGNVVAAALEVHPGNISRQKERAVKRLHDALASLDASADPGRAYGDCLEILAHARNLRELADVFLTALSELQDDVGQPFPAVMTVRTGHPTAEHDSATEADA